MPELPEVEGARRLAERNVVGKRITAATIADDEKVIAGISHTDLEQALIGRTLKAAKRRGKQMWWDFDSGPSLLLHFGMTGGLVIRGVGAAHYKSQCITTDDAWPPRFCKLELAFDDGTLLAFCDSRRFAKVRFLAQPESVLPISALGWDPMLDMPPLDAFAVLLTAHRRAIKALLLDQSFSAGVGNWVADEVLYQSRVHPEQPANSIPADKVAALHRALVHVVQLACEVEADYRQFPADWLFHFRWGKGKAAKSSVGGNGIEHITVGGRTSAIVPALQKLDKAAAAAALAAAAAKKKAASTGRAASKKASGAAKKAVKREVEGQGDEEEDVQVAVVAAAAVPAPRKRRGKAAASDAPAPEPTIEAAGPAPRKRRGKAVAVVVTAPEPTAAAPEPPAAARSGKRFRSGRQAAADAALVATTGDDDVATEVVVAVKLETPKCKAPPSTNVAAAAAGMVKAETQGRVLRARKI